MDEVVLASAQRGEDGMDDRYEAYAMADPSFYDAMHSDATAGPPFATARRPLPEGWRRAEQAEWFMFTPGGLRLPAQGWKIHASATMDGADRVLDAVWDHCVAHGIAFKFLRSRPALLARVSKYAARGLSGKLATIYPVDERACEEILTELGAVLDGEPGPYILSDLRWGAGPLFVRYGGFVNRYGTDEHGEVVPVIADADGALVPDRRGPVFAVPPWVRLPDFLAPHLAARNAVTVAGLPYAIERVLHFSNGGGVYLARDTRTGAAVVLKEARPHAGLDARGHDAVRRLDREYDTLRRLAGVPGVPRVHEVFWLGEHRFLAMEYVDGVTLSAAIVERYPLVDPNAGPAAYAAYTDWALGIFGRVEATMAGIHARRVVYGDLHLHNIVVRPDGAVTLLDFEVASDVDTATRPGLASQGFAAPRGAVGFAIDAYAQACLRLALFLPMTPLLGLHRPKAREYARVIADHFPVPDSFLARGVDVIVPPDTPAVPVPRIEVDPTEWPRLRDRLARAIVASATPDREDRLFPGDVEQFAVGGLGLAHGAAGVLYALDVTGAGRHERFERWLADRAVAPAAGTRLGLYDGLSGVAFALDHLGHRQAALDVVDVCLRDMDSLGPDLAAGLSGLGLVLLHLADRTGEPGLRRAGLRAADRVATQVADLTADPTAEWLHAGLMRGAAGAAVLLTRAYDDTGDSSYLDGAAAALRVDLDRCVRRDTGALEVDEGWRTMPYLEAGSVGIGLALDEYLARRDDDELADAGRGIDVAASSPMYILPGLFSGRAGIIVYLAARSASPTTDAAVAAQVRALAWHALPYADGLAFPGHALLRLSMDLATGTAGVLLALGAAHDPAPARTPALPAWPARPARAELAQSDSVALATG
jgi:hypothetical protein